MRQFALGLFLTSLFAITFTWLSFSAKNEKSAGHPIKTAMGKPVSTEFTKLQARAFKAKQFLKENSFDTSFCFLIDMSLPANRKRFFVYDLQSDTVSNAGLVTHGNCNQYWLQGRKYGNDIGCGCTSLGKYRIGKAYQGRFGLAFKLYGLDSTNSNAFNRFVVLHSHDCVPDNETEDNICQSNGCPTVAPAFLKQLNAIIKRSGKPILLWIFYPD